MVAPVIELRKNDLPSTISWEGLNSSATGDAGELNSGIKRGTIVFAGTFDSGTFTLEVSNDGVFYAPLKDLENVVIDATAAESFHFVTTGGYFRIAVSGGASADVDVSANWFLLTNRRIE